MRKQNSSESIIRKIKRIEKQLKDAKALHRQLDDLYLELLKTDKSKLKDLFKNKTVIFKTAHFKRYELK